ncbi:hypothetical protein C7S16_6867 [Burkholderia thailandensis]|uniref:Uncharacterized protein n=1 Tax=Burkholderia thailandensis TaxID=57975 RepID=A0AAW9CRN4_BURTH|nr:hypothetical protein [Burkholderia thailandensis]
MRSAEIGRSTRLARCLAEHGREKVGDISYGEDGLNGRGGLSVAGISRRYQESIESCA